MGSSDILKVNRNLFKKMKEIASKQEEYISGDEIEKFIDLSRKRERLQHEISANNRRSGIVVKSNDDGRGREKNDSISMEIVDVIKSIQETDRRIEKLIIENKEGVLHDINKIRKGRRAIKGYGGKHYNSPKFIKKRG